MQYPQHAISLPPLNQKKKTEHVYLNAEIVNPKIYYHLPFHLPVVFSYLILDTRISVRPAAAPPS